MTQHAVSAIASDDVMNNAAYWCMRLQAKDCTNEERVMFQQWLSADPAHASEYQAMLEVWHISDHLPKLATLETTPACAARTLPRRRRFKPGVAAAAALFLSLGTLLGWYQGWLPKTVRHYQSAEQTQHITLPDGSRVQLNLGSSLWFGNFRDRRSILLSTGEAFFDVQHDAQHPFVVRANKGSITVTGTQFNVWKDEEQVVVILQEGSVTVHNNIEDPEQIAYLSPGQQAHYNTHNQAPHISSARLDSLAWRAGKLILDDLTLSQALPLINRYLSKPVLLADQATGDIRIGGVYGIHSIDELVQTLPKVLPVYLSQNSTGHTVISSR